MVMNFSITEEERRKMDAWRKFMHMQLTKYSESRRQKHEGCCSSKSLAELR
jgi:hypothetical protein